jgi:peptidoglycan biosynthesis protein MviN/MurJ (putative lipid II flippase)
MVQRHPIGLFAPVGISIFVIAFIASVMVNFSMIMNSLFDPNGFYLPDMGPVYAVGGLLIILVSLLCYVNVWVYVNNTFFLTNESVIQEIQVSLFSKHEQTVSLQNIEDASYRQQGLMQTLWIDSVEY